ncbi:MAG TPA: AzlC family ABC transporter permease [Stellaceae bacterium]|nr:AzlC family ABC transporter permease [Stellaceae bacterium]
MRALFESYGLRAGARRCAPIALSVFAYGLVFGALAAQDGLSLGETGLMSAIVFSGSVQFVALGLWATPLPVAALLIATFLLSLRLVLMGATLRRALAGISTGRALVAAWFVTDENWALTMSEAAQRGSRPEAQRPPLASFFMGTSILLYGTWIAAGIVGHLIGGAVGDPKHLGFDFAFPAMFLALSIGLGRRHPNVLVWLASAASAILAERYLGGAWHILVGAGAGIAVAALGHKTPRRAP